MITKAPPGSSTLYDSDYLLWLEKTAQQLRDGLLFDLDVENLIAEIESMGKSERHSVASWLTLILVHLLKLYYWEAERERNANHWRGEITSFRVSIRRKLADSPSLKPYLEEIFPECYQDARRISARTMGVKIDSLSAEPLATLEQALDDNWFVSLGDGN